MKKNNLSVVELTKRLVEIPSYVSMGHNEVELVDFLEKYVAMYLPMYQRSIQQLQGDTRSNLYLRGDKPTRILFVGHVDTVMPSDGWVTDPLTPIIKDGALFGLGAADMKGSIAALLVALQEVDADLLAETAVLLYLDEEYDFAGMEQLIRDDLYRESNKPEIIISLDGGLDILSGCRGLIKLEMEVTGKSGHASNPANGVNVITNLTTALKQVDDMLSSYASKALGKSTMNVAYLRAGAVEDVNNPAEMQTAGNVIPNYAECIVEFRPASPRLNGDEAARIVSENIVNLGLSIKSMEIKHDLGAWLGSFDSSVTSLIQACYKQAGVPWHPANPQYIGFIDVQMLCRVLSSPTYVIGAGGINRHGANEHVALAALDNARDLYKIIINNFLRKEKNA